ncbi:MAG: hypothetical protein Q9222_004582 [Ikaeria aurantiellina]
MVVTASFIAILEYLSQRSRRDGGIAFAKDQFSSWIRFAYLYLPTVAAVLYSILWSWVDLDVKRLEPYFQLSKPDGATAADSLLLHYPFDFVAYAPFKALRKRHWAVVFAGTAMMCIFWGVTPLASSVFAQSAVTIERRSTASMTASLMPLEKQSSALNTAFMMTAYGIAWLGQAVPGYVTSDGVVQPFRVDDIFEKELANMTWTAQSTLYGTTLNCNPAIIKNDMGSMWYSDGKGCTVNVGLDSVSEFSGVYIGYYTDQHTDYSLLGLGCSSTKYSSQFLAIWGQSHVQHPTTTALFCEPDYWTQDVNATVMVPSMNVSKVVPVAPRVPLSDNHFNRSAFEYNIGTGAQPISERADISDTTSVINQKANLAEVGVNGLTTNMIGFALGLTRLDPALYTEPGNLVMSLLKAHKLLHALAVKQLMVPTSGTEEGESSTAIGKSKAVVVVRSLALLVEVFLGLVVILIAALLIHASRRPSQLVKDPASLRDIVYMSAHEREVETTQQMHIEEAEERYRLLDGKICLSNINNAVQRPCGIAGKETKKTASMTIIEQRIPKESRSESPLIRPIEMSLGVAFLFISLLFLAVGTVGALKIYADKHAGLPLPSRSALVNQLILNYVLIVFATFLEPFWLLLNRQLCVLQPFEELRCGNAKASRSLNLKYTSLPPQLTLWRALKGRHRLLSAICAVGLSANLMAVSLSGLLEINPVSIETPGDLGRPYQPMFSNVSARPDTWDYQYVAKVNISDGVALPPWTTPEVFFVPFSTEARSALGPVERIQATTQGIGIQTSCEEAFFNDTAFVTGQSNLFLTQQRMPSGKNVTCGGNLQPYGGQNKSNAAAESFGPLQPIDTSESEWSVTNSISILANATQEENLTCQLTVVAGFLRGNLTVSLDNTKTDNTLLTNWPEVLSINLLSSLWMTCRPRLMSASYRVTVDRFGHVQSFSKTGPYADDLTAFFESDTTPEILMTTATSILAEGSNTGQYWHNDTFVDTWFGYFVKHLSNSTDLIDPSKPVPTFTEAVPYVKDIYARLFAIVLGLNQNWLAEAEKGATIAGIFIVPCQRVFVSRPMFIITVVLLALNIIVAIAYWARRPKKMLPAMPYTVASILAMVKGSGLVSEVGNVAKWENEWRFGYGRFVGTDGKPHVGLERRPFVVPLET